MLTELSFCHGFQLVRVVRVADIHVPLGLFTFARIACLFQLRVKTIDLDYSIWATFQEQYTVQIEFHSFKA